MVFHSRLAAFLFYLLSSAVGSAEVLTLTLEKGEERDAHSQPFSIQEGETAEIIYTSHTDIRLDVTIGEKSFWLGSTNTGHSGVAFQPTIPIIAGPAQIRLVTENPYQGYKALATFKITRAAVSGTNTVPATAVVIPEDSDGQYEVILESSTDMLTWTAAMPGNYGGDTIKRFFRTRIVKKP